MFFHLKIFLRKLRRDGIYSVINIGGLAIGMAAAILTFGKSVLNGSAIRHWNSCNRQ